MRATHSIASRLLFAALLLSGRVAAQDGLPRSLPCEATGDNSGLPPGFRKVQVTPALQQPIAIAFDPEGRLFVAERGGRILLVSSGVVASVPVLDLPNVSTLDEQGLHGIALDPEFAVNGLLYVRYTTTEPRNRLSRFRVVNDVADPASEQILWEAADLASAWHHGGDLAFGPDGMLYTSTGDAQRPIEAQDVGTTIGKILRIRADGSAPGDNPFASGPDADPRVWALGLRSPFRFSFDPATGRMWIGDVGSYGPTAAEEINRGAAGANYGWPNQEGNVCFIDNCTAYTLPAFAYRRDDARYSSDGLSASIIAGPVYRADVYPADFRGNVFFGDYANLWIRRLLVDENGAVVGDAPFLTAPKAGRVVDLRVGPDGLLYFVTIGLGEDEGAPAVYRIDFDPDFDRPPVAVASASPVAGNPPLLVQFSSAGSYDPDDPGAELVYCWDFGDGASSNDAHPTHEYTRPGRFQARLTVRSGKQADSAPPITITATKPPLGDIITPEIDTIYRAGQTIVFSGAGYDVEDGWLAPSAFTWDVDLVHANHVHPFLGPLVGVRQGRFVIPDDGHSPEDTHYRIRLTLTDSDRLTTIVERDVFPEVAPLVFLSEPSGVAIFIDGEPTTTPRAYNGLVGFRHHLEARETVERGGITYTFAGWSTGEPLAHTFETPEGGAEIIVRYVPATPPPDTPAATPGIDQGSARASDQSMTCPLLGWLGIGLAVVGVVRQRRRDVG